MAFWGGVGHMVATRDLQPDETLEKQAIDDKDCFILTRLKLYQNKVTYVSVGHGQIHHNVAVLILITACDVAPGRS